MIMRKYLKKILLAIVTVVILGAIVEVRVFAEETGLKMFGIHVINETTGLSYDVNWWQKQELSMENKYYITIPYSARNQMLTVNFVGKGPVIFNGEKIVNGSEIDLLHEGENHIECAGEEYTLFVIYGSDIPTIHITTETGTLENVYENKSYKEPGHVVVLDDQEVVYQGELEYIKGRGNSTWTNYEKKPFNIKFKEKVNLFEMGQAKKWCLLANSLDDTLLRSKLVADFADTVGIHFSSKSIIVDLYVNNEYVGNYTLMENVEIGSSRVNITDLEELNEIANPDVVFEELELAGVRGKDSYTQTGSYKWVELPHTLDVISGGYLIEYELASRYDKEVSGFISNYGQPVILKSPEYASKEQVEYIKNYYQEFEDAARNSDGYNEKGKHYSDYIDVDSMAKMYIFQEYLKNLDAGLTSFYYYKDVDGKLVAAPAWDFDSAFGREYVRNDVHMDDPEGLWATNGKLHNELSDKSTILSIMCRHVKFRELAQKQWVQYFKPNTEELLLNLETLYQESYASIVADKCKWSSKGNYTMTAEWVDDSVIKLKDFIVSRTEFMSDMFSDNKCYIGYQANGGEGGMYDHEFYNKGSAVQTLPNAFYNGEKTFLGWNTKASGWGESYSNGDIITLEKNIVLYAQWEKDGIIDEMKAFFQGILGK